MQLKAILTTLVAAIVLVTAAPAVDISAVPPGTRLSKIIDLNDGALKNGDLNDAASKIIFVPGGGYPGSPYYPGSQDPTIIIIKPNDPYGSILTRHPGKRTDDENEDSKLLVTPQPFHLPGSGPYIGLPFPSQGYPSGWPGGRPFPKRHDGDKSSKKKRAKAMNEADVDHDDYDWEEDEDEGTKYIYPPWSFWHILRPKHIMY